MEMNLWNAQYVTGCAKHLGKSRGCVCVWNILYASCSNMRTGGRTSLIISLREERTAWWWSPMRMANGTTCPATTSCPTSARKAQVCEREGERGKEVCLACCLLICVLFCIYKFQDTFEHLLSTYINATSVHQFKLLSHLIIYHILNHLWSFICFLASVTCAFYTSFCCASSDKSQSGNQQGCDIGFVRRAFF